MKAVSTWLIKCSIIALFASASSWGDGISGTGSVSRFASVVLDGVHYDTSSSVIRLNGVRVRA